MPNRISQLLTCNFLVYSPETGVHGSTIFYKEFGLFGAVLCVVCDNKLNRS